MNTRRIESPAEAASMIRAGGIVAFPTETVFGLGVDATNTAAVERLFAAKGRPSNNPLIVHLSDACQWSQAARELTDSASALLDAFAPGPLTVVLPKSDSVSSLVTAGLDTVGLRAPDHSTAQAILKMVDRPVAAPSANRSGRPSGTKWKTVLEDLDGRIDGIFCEDSPSIGIESTVVDCTGELPMVLRLGAVTVEQIRGVIPETLDLTGSEPESSVQVRSPGIMHPHYQPKAQVLLFEAQLPDLSQFENGVAYCGLQELAANGELALSQIFSNVEEYAAGFYEFLREADRRSIATVIVSAAPEEGIGSALLDRQRRAAASENGKLH